MNQAGVKETKSSSDFFSTSVGSTQEWPVTSILWPPRSGKSGHSRTMQPTCKFNDGTSAIWSLPFTASAYCSGPVV